MKEFERLEKVLRGTPKIFLLSAIIAFFFNIYFALFNLLAAIIVRRVSRPILSIKTPPVEVESVEAIGLSYLRSWCSLVEEVVRSQGNETFWIAASSSTQSIRLDEEIHFFTIVMDGMDYGSQQTLTTISTFLKLLINRESSVPVMVKILDSNGSTFSPVHLVTVISILQRFNLFRLGVDRESAQHLQITELTFNYPGVTVQIEGLSSLNSVHKNRFARYLQSQADFLFYASSGTLEIVDCDAQKTDTATEETETLPRTFNSFARGGPVTIRSNSMVPPDQDQFSSETKRFINNSSFALSPSIAKFADQLDRRNLDQSI